MSNNIFDLAIIGTGSVGSAAGYYASQHHSNILELDIATPPHSLGSHHGQTRIIRHAYGEGEKYIPLLLEAQRLWDELQKKSGKHLFHKTGVLTVGPKNSDFLNNIKDSAQDYNIDITPYTSSQIHDKWNNWNFNDQYEGVLEPGAGYLESEEIIRTYIEGAKQNGVTQNFDSFVKKIEQQDDGTVKIETQDHTFYAQNVILSAGTWVKQLLPNLPITPTRKVFAWFNVNDASLNEADGFPAFTVELKNDAQYYGFPGSDGTIKIGRHQGGQKISTRKERGKFGDYPEDLHEIDPLLKHHLSGTNGIDHGGSCSYDLSPDGDFIIDRVPSMNKIQIVTGLSGHGFKFASVLGKLLSDQAFGKQSSYNLEPFKLDRFKQG